jgi:hypothetical protein
MDTYNKLKIFQKTNTIGSILEKCQVTQINIKDNPSLTIVSAVNERSKQTYFSLKTWNYAAQICGTYFQYILVEDSKNDKINCNLLNYSNLTITHIYIPSKTWINPCINYNIGFEFIKAENVVITNPEICIFGNIYPIIINKLSDDNYLVFDVTEIGKPHCIDNYNQELWKKCDNLLSYQTIINFLKDKETFVLQGKGNNRRLHFLTAIKTSNLKKIGGFDEDFAFGVNMDDENLILKIMHHQIKIESLYNDNVNVLGIHQWHSKNIHIYKDGLKTQKQTRNINRSIHKIKVNYIKKTNKYLQFRNTNNYSETS